MKNKITLNILAAYLPYELKVGFDNDEHAHAVVGLEISRDGLMLISPFGDFGRASIENAKPILRPLSDLTKPISDVSEATWIDVLWHEVIGTDSDSFNKEDFYEICELGMINFLPYMVIPKLLSWHFNIFNLPESDYIKL